MDDMYAIWIFGGIWPYPGFIQIFFKRKNSDKVHIFLCLSYKGLKLNDKLIAVDIEAQILFMDGIIYTKASRFCLTYCKFSICSRIPN